MDVDTANLVWFLVLGVVVPAAFVVRAFASPTPRQLQRWARAAGVTITAANEPQVRRRLGRTRRFRSVAAFPFWWLAFAPLLDSDFPSGPDTPLFAVTAYVLGGILAELTTPDPAPGPLRQAALLARSVGDYEPPWVRAFPWMLVALSAFLVSIAPSTGGLEGSMVEAWVSSVVAAAVTAFAATVARRIAGRPQPGADPDALAADDALRATGIASCRSGAAILGLGALSAAVSVAVPERSPWSVVFLLVSLVLLGMWFAMLTVVVRQETWGHRLRFRQTPQAPTPTAPGAPPAPTGTLPTWTVR